MNVAIKQAQNEWKSKRDLIENVFGILCAKFRLLLKAIETEVGTAICIVKALCVLHNFLIDETKEADRPGLLADQETEDHRDIDNGIWRHDTYILEQSQHLPPHAMNSTKAAKEIRNKLIHFSIAQKEQSIGRMI